jgi:hypothetical protein
MLTFNLYAGPSGPGLRTLVTIGPASAADEPSHIHIPRPTRVRRMAAGATSHAEAGR